MNKRDRESLKARSSLLVAEHRLGNVEAFPELYRLHAGVVRGYARKVACLWKAPPRQDPNMGELIQSGKKKPITDAEWRLNAICTTVWTIVQEKIEDFDLKKDFRKWILGITHSEAKQDLRLDATRPRMLSLEERHPDESLPHDERVALKMDVERALQFLEEDERELVVLKFFQDLSLDELAAELELPKTTIATRLRVVLDKLRPHLMSWSRYGRSKGKKS
jgi:RNA polymerase sigma-70 factor (ECF subfamily)